MRLIKEYEVKNSLKIKGTSQKYLWPSKGQGLHYLNYYSKSYHIMHPNVD